MVGLNAAPVTGVDDLRTLAAPVPVPAAVFSVRREAATLEVTMGEGREVPVPGEAGSGGIVWESPPQGFLVEAVQPGSRAAAAGLRPGDRVMRLGTNEPRALDQVRRTLDARTGPAIFVGFERAGRRRGALVTREAR